MNAERRKRIERVKTTLAEAQEELRMLADEEQSAFDNIPESLAETEQTQQSEEAIQTLEDAQTELENIAETLTTIL